MFCSGTYQLTLLITPNTPFNPTGGHWFALILSTQITAGLLGAIALYRLRVTTPAEPASLPVEQPTPTPTHPTNRPKANLKPRPTPPSTT
jgi:hypothetical protein